jgi:hypothetical protein
MPIDTGLGSIYKRKYCEGDKKICARYKVAQAVGKEFVPLSLYPNMNDKADEIIRQNQPSFAK